MERSPNRQEAVAIAAAVQRFLADTSPAKAGKAQVGPWQRAALLEGVGAKEAPGDSQGGDRWPS